MRSVFFVFTSVLVLFFSGCTTVKESVEEKTDYAILETYELSENQEELDKLQFDEIWGYLYASQNDRLPENCPVTDIGYFGAGLSTFGSLCDVPDVTKLKQTGKTDGKRIHMVVADNGKALTHFCISPEYNVRHKLINDIADAAVAFDGVQIDFELVSLADAEHYISFLTELKHKLKGKIFSVAVPARMKKNEIYDYEKISAIADKILIMAYDEHWSTSKPGPVASVEWCKKILDYAKTVLSKKQLIMGIPFYGRAWADVNPATAYRYVTLQKLIKEKNFSEDIFQRTDSIPNFKYEQTVNVTVFYEDCESVKEKAALYRKEGISQIGFWCIGQEQSEVWDLFR